MFMARPHRRALAFLGFWVRQAPCGTPRIGAAVEPGLLPGMMAILLFFRELGHFALSSALGIGTAGFGVLVSHAAEKKIWTDRRVDGSNPKHAWSA
jgi:hypothetical protein